MPDGASRGLPEQGQKPVAAMGDLDPTASHSDSAFSGYHYHSQNRPEQNPRLPNWTSFQGQSGLRRATCRAEGDPIGNSCRGWLHLS